jgi:hypothetical protein
MEPMIVAFWMLFWGIIGGVICQPKGRTRLGFLLGAALGPIGLLITLFMRDIRCPHCRAPLLARDASVCSACGRSVS